MHGFGAAVRGAILLSTVPTAAMTHGWQNGCMQICRLKGSGAGLPPKISRSAIASQHASTIHLQDKLLLLLSEHALASAWVKDEVEAALEKERRQGRDVLFPVRLDDAVMHATHVWAAKVRRTRHIGDFTHWETASAYDVAFARLLHDLRHD
jgi:hypothetical protein